MEFKFNVEDIALRVFGLTSIDEIKGQNIDFDSIDTTIANPKPKFIPMMTARRLSDGCKLAVDAAMELSGKHDIDAVIFSSASGELLHNYKVLNSAVTKTDVSPTDFSMSVHNAAVGNFTILSKSKIPSSSICAGIDSFMQALTDAYAMLNQGANKVLVVDYDVSIPEFFKLYLDENYPVYPHALALVLTRGDEFTVKTARNENDMTYKQFASVDFLDAYTNDKKSFVIAGRCHNYEFTRI